MPRAVARHLPGEVGTWVFISGDLLIFGLFFFTFLFYRGQDPGLYERSQSLLDQRIGALNTTLLLLSSLLVALGVRAARMKQPRAAGPLILGAIACGIGFGVVKIFEWGEKIGAGLTLTSNEFFTFYYMFTGIHMLHVLIGLGLLAYVLSIVRAGRFADTDLRAVESVATFWHLVDMLWLVLFALLYLMK